MKQSWWSRSKKAVDPPMNRLRMKQRYFWNSYRCHRYRGKTHFQILLELFAKFIVSPSISVRLMKLSLRRHGIFSNIEASAVLPRPSARAHSVKRGEILSGRFFIDV